MLPLSKIQPKSYNPRKKRRRKALSSSRVNHPTLVRLLYSILPYAVDRVDVTEQGSTDPRDKAFTVGVVASEGTPGTHVFHVTVIDPSGNERPEYAKNVKAEAGTASVKVRMALSDAEGFWRVKARDTASGHFGQAKFEYRAP